MVKLFAINRKKTTRLLSSSSWDLKKVQKMQSSVKGSGIERTDLSGDGRSGKP